MLIYLVMALLAGAVVAIVQLAVTLTPLLSAATWIIVLLLIERTAGHASRGRALRPVVGATVSQPIPDSAPGLPGSARWYIEAIISGVASHSCSFIEFDERGDYLDFFQHRHAYQKVLELATTNQPLTVVIYVHGWRHSGQSQDVVAFNEFLHQLADAEDVDGTRRRVHGVYLAWRGALLRHVVNEDSTFRGVSAYYGSPIVALRERSRVPWLTILLETFSYFDRKSIPEHKFSGTALSRSIFSCAFAAKRNSNNCQVLLLGHSFGGLMLERTVQNAAISQLTGAWPWGQATEAEHRINPLPFDTVLLVNSAAPSIYAKQFQGYLAAHRQAMLRARVPRADTPFVFSITSSADWATGIAHPIANRLSFVLPTLWRNYSSGDFTLEQISGNQNVEIPQSYYYRLTPGHNPLLVNRFIEPVHAYATPTMDKRSHVRNNLVGRRANLNRFDVAKRDGTGTVPWNVDFPPVTPQFNKFSHYSGFRPVVWTRSNGFYIYQHTAYWIIRCPAEIIAGHNDIWGQPAMDVYAALHRIALQASPHAQ